MYDNWEYVTSTVGQPREPWTFHCLKYFGHNQDDGYCNAEGGDDHKDDTDDDDELMMMLIVIIVTVMAALILFQPSILSSGGLATYLTNMTNISYYAWDQ